LVAYVTTLATTGIKVVCGLPGSFQGMETFRCKIEIRDILPK